ncbi:Hypothetical protein SCLAV_5676 [Streptomyces clavuligerus]|uniref:Uncharacterized protein n=1 Tax=Streptomyces clavuligerus TaxID=1901 RepID=E2Q2N2_STRCL|nr:Hypothetical protein SCLAV_5676 [Streptomyces clavuligerus]
MTAARDGEPFDPHSGLPACGLRARERRTTWYGLAQEYIEQRWDRTPGGTEHPGSLPPLRHVPRRGTRAHQPPALVTPRAPDGNHPRSGALFQLLEETQPLR